MEKKSYKYPDRGAPVPTGYSDIIRLVDDLREHHPWRQSRQFVNYAYVEKLLKRYNSGGKYYCEYLRDFLRDEIEKERDRIYQSTFYRVEEGLSNRADCPNIPQNIWLLVYSDKITKEITVLDKNGKPTIKVVPLLPKFEPFILDINAANIGWTGQYIAQMRNYIFLKGDDSKREMIQNVLNLMKENQKLIDNLSSENKKLTMQLNEKPR